MQKALAAVRTWVDACQDEAAELLLAMDRLGPASSASPDELAAIDTALAETQRGAFGSDAEVEAAYARFRK